MSQRITLNTIAATSGTLTIGDGNTTETLINGGIGITGSLIANSMTVSNSTPASSTSVGALVLSGPLGATTINTPAVSGLNAPVNPSDATTKTYVDANITSTVTGTDKQVQYNNSGVFGAVPNFTFTVATGSTASTANVTSSLIATIFESDNLSLNDNTISPIGITSSVLLGSTTSIDVITGLVDPVLNTDIVSKGYVDSLAGSVHGGGNPKGQNAASMSIQYNEDSKFIGSAYLTALGTSLQSTAIQSNDIKLHSNNITSKNNIGVEFISYQQKGSSITTGSSIGMSSDGNTAIVGSNGNATIFVRTGSVGNGWVQDTVLTIGATGNISTSIEGIYAIVGGDGDSSGIGAAWVFTKGGGTWVQESKLVGTGHSGASHQGFAVSIANSATPSAIIGAPNNNGGIGCAYVFNKIAGTWQQTGMLVGSGLFNQGTSVDISVEGTRVVFGGNLSSSGTSAVGGALIFSSTTGPITWSQEAKLIGTGNIGNSKQGTSVSIGNGANGGSANDGGTAVVIGGPGNNNGIGAMWVFNRFVSQTGIVSWIQSAKLTGEVAQSKQGASISLSTDGTKIVSNDDVGILTFEYCGGWIQYHKQSSVGECIQVAMSDNILAMKTDGTVIYITEATDLSSTLFINGDVTVSGAVILPNIGINNITVTTISTSGLTITTDTITASGSDPVILDGNVTIDGSLSITTGSTIGDVIVNDTFSPTGTVTSTGTTTLVGTSTLGGTVDMSSASSVLIPTVTGSTAITGTLTTPEFLTTGMTFEDRVLQSSANLQFKFINTGTFAPQTATPTLTSGIASGNFALSVDISDNGLVSVFGSNGNGCFIGNGTGGGVNSNLIRLVGTSSGLSATQGVSVSISYDGTVVLMGSSSSSTLPPPVWVFSTIYGGPEGTWEQYGLLVASGYSGGTATTSVVSISGNGNVVGIGAADDNGTGAVYVFNNVNGIYTQVVRLIGTGYTGSSRQGQSLSLNADGTVLAVGGSGDNGDVGAIWLYTKVGSTWVQYGNKLRVSGNDGASAIGFSISIDSVGKVLVVGGPNDGADSGTTGGIWIFEKTGSNWIQNGGRLIGTGASYGSSIFGAKQGWSVSINSAGNYIAVGGPGDNPPFNVAYQPGIGAVWLFGYGSTPTTVNTWKQVANKLVGVGTTGTRSGQGTSVSIGNTLLVGGPQNNANVGGAWYYNNGTNSGIVDYMSMNMTGAAIFDQSVLLYGGISTTTLDGSMIVANDVTVTGTTTANIITSETSTVYATGTSITNIGAQFIDGFTKEVGLIGYPTTASTNQGTGAAIHNSILVSGSPSNNTIYVFTSNGSNNVGGYSQQTTLIGTGMSGNAQQGTSISIGGTSISGSYIISGGPADYGGAGAAWSFVNTGGAWVQLDVKIGPTYDYVRGPNTLFGSSVALDPTENYLAIGGPGQFGGTLLFRRMADPARWQNIYPFDPYYIQGSSAFIQQGYSVTINYGGTMVVSGAPADVNGGSVTAYYRLDNDFFAVQIPNIFPTGYTGAARFGNSVSVNDAGDTLVVGGPGDNGNVGAVWVFNNSGGYAGSWSQVGNKLVSSNYIGTPSQGLNVSVSSSGNTFISVGSASTWSFGRTGGVWSEINVVGGVGGGQGGTTNDGGVIVVGNPTYTGLGTTGEVVIYRRNNKPLVVTGGTFDMSTTPLMVNTGSIYSKGILSCNTLGVQNVVVNGSAFAYGNVNVSFGMFNTTNLSVYNSTLYTNLSIVGNFYVIGTGIYQSLNTNSLTVHGTTTSGTLSTSALTATGVTNTNNLINNGSTTVSGTNNISSISVNFCSISGDYTVNGLLSYYGAVSTETPIGYSLHGASYDTQLWTNDPLLGGTYTFECGAGEGPSFKQFSLIGGSGTGYLPQYTVDTGIWIITFSVPIYQYYVPNEVDPPLQGYSNTYLKVVGGSGVVYTSGNIFNVGTQPYPSSDVSYFGFNSCTYTFSFVLSSPISSTLNLLCMVDKATSPSNGVICVVALGTPIATLNPMFLTMSALRIA